MNKKGFTLIELLAVIVILAIIALIATPIILNVIETAKEGSLENSALGYFDAVEKQVMMSKINSTATNIEPGTYTVAQLKTLGVNVKGETPKDDGVITIGDKGQVTNAWITYKDSDYKVYYDGNQAVADTNDYIDSKGNKHNDIGTPNINVEGPLVLGDIYSSANIKQLGVVGYAYLDPTNLTKTCNSANSTLGSGTSGCMKFYIYADDGTNYKMILDHNAVNGIKWDPVNMANSTYSTSNAYTSVQNLGWDSSLNPTLITIEEVNTITGKTGFDKENDNSKYYLDSKSSSRTVASKGESAYSWLYENMNDCESYGCDASANNGGTTYLTQSSGYITMSMSMTACTTHSTDCTPTTSEVVTKINVWAISRSSQVTTVAADSSTSIRPVITVPKSIFNQ